MMGKLIGAAVGRRLAGPNSGARGALLGALAPAIGRRMMGPLGLAVGGAWVAKKLWDRRAASRSGSLPAGGGRY